jgi:hypothetical protein
VVAIVADSARTEEELVSGALQLARTSPKVMRRAMEGIALEILDAGKCAIG